jgi:hypothetical protein
MFVSRLYLWCSNVYLLGSTVAEIHVQSVVVNGSLEAMKKQAAKVKKLTFRIIKDNKHAWNKILLTAITQYITCS